MLATQSREKRQSFTAQFKLQVIREALQRPATNRIKPTCREHPEITPVRASPLLSRAIWGNRPVCPVSSAGCAAFLSVLAVSAGATAQVDTQPRGPRTRAANSQVPCEGERQRRHEATSLPQYQEARRGGGFLGARDSDGRDPVIRGHDSRPNGRCSLGPPGLLTAGAYKRPKFAMDASMSSTQASSNAGTFPDVRPPPPKPRQPRRKPRPTPEPPISHACAFKNEGILPRCLPNSPPAAASSWHLTRRLLYAPASCALAPPLDAHLSPAAPS